MISKDLYMLNVFETDIGWGHGTLQGGQRFLLSMLS